MTALTHPAGVRLRLGDRVIEEDGCWVWRRSRTPAGYGDLWVDGRHLYAHRWTWEMFHGRDPASLEVHHTCRLRACCNPEHLEALPRWDHMAHHRKKLTNEQVDEIVRSPMTVRALAAIHGVTHQTVWYHKNAARRRAA